VAEIERVAERLTRDVLAETALYRDAILATADRMDIEVARHEPASVAANLGLSPADVVARLPRTWTRD